MQKRNRRSGVEDRWTKTVRDDRGNETRVPSARDGKGLRWLARYVGDDGRERTKSFGRKADAQRWLNDQTAALVTGVWVAPERGAVTFQSFYTSWSARQVWVPSTRANSAAYVATVPFWTTAMSEIRRSHIEAWIKALDGTLAASTIKTRFASVRAVFRAAVADKVIAADPTERVVLPRTRKPEAAMSVPTDTDVGKLVNGAEGPMRAYVALCAFAGLRLGEACGVKVGDVDFLRKRLIVERQIQRDGVNPREAPPKWGSERTVYLPDELVTILSQHVAAYPPAPDGWLFHLDGKAWTDNKVTYRWRQTRKAAGLTTKLHSLRHYFASGLIAQGCDVVTVQRALGHSSATTTLNTYSHLWPTAEDRTRAAAGALAKAALSPAADQLRTGG